MIALVRTRTLRALRDGLSEAETATTAARAEAAQRQQSAEIALEEQRAALAQAAVDVARLEGELAALRAQSLLDTEDRQALRTLLRTVRKQLAREADRVHILFRSGELHSVHATRDAAEIAAEAEGASRDGWISLPASWTDSPASASETRWRLQSFALGGTR
ncbi:hypothetical protein OG422_05815 [Streptomyces sp. NBC_01525]|uniref:hypothetical protein n=1 Tax=Streptomyces sp. NBC_01525 TaxID=2903893 RepID=UPI0038642231